MESYISINQLSDSIRESLDVYDKDVINGIKKENEKAMVEFVKLTKTDAPKSKKKRSGTFSKNITSKKTFEDSRSSTHTWYVKDPEYRLTHLLKNGHQTRNGGRTKPQDFLTDNFNKTIEHFEKNIEKVIKSEY